MGGSHISSRSYDEQLARFVRLTMSECVQWSTQRLCPIRRRALSPINVVKLYPKGKDDEKGVAKVLETLCVQEFGGPADVSSRSF